MPPGALGQGAGVDVPRSLRDVLLEAEQLRTEVEIACADGRRICGMVTEVGSDVVTVADGPRRHDLALFHVVGVGW